MPVRIRMTRGGTKKRPYYQIVVADSRSPRDGRFIEKVGSYDPMLKHDDPKRVVLNKERIAHWLKVGALPSDRIHRFLHKAEMLPALKINEQPKKSAPRAKTQERLKAQAAAEAAAAEKPAEAAAPAADAPAQA